MSAMKGLFKGAPHARGGDARAIHAAWLSGALEHEDEAIVAVACVQGELEVKRVGPDGRALATHAMSAQARTPRLSQAYVAEQARRASQGRVHFPAATALMLQWHLRVSRQRFDLSALSFADEGGNPMGPWMSDDEKAIAALLPLLHSPYPEVLQRSRGLLLNEVPKLRGQRMKVRAFKFDGQALYVGAAGRSRHVLNMSINLITEGIRRILAR